MGGDSYAPTVVYGFVATNYDDLQLLKKIYKKHLERLESLHQTRSVQRKRDIDIFHCTEDAYSRWEGMGAREIFDDYFGRGYASSFACLGLNVHEEELGDVKPLKELLSDIQNDMQNRVPTFKLGIFMYSESTKEDYGVEDTEDEGLEVVEEFYPATNQEPPSGIEVQSTTSLKQKLLPKTQEAAP